MIEKYWISKRTREWGILESGLGRLRAATRSLGWRDNLPNPQDLLNRLEETGFVLLDRIEFLLLSKTLDERGEPLSFSPLPPEGPASAPVSLHGARQFDWETNIDSFAQAA